MGSKTIILSEKGWANNYYKTRTKKRQLIQVIFSLAAQYGWAVHMKGQHWQ